MAQGRKTGGGSRKGVPNKATADVREAIALLLQSNVENFSVWLAAVAAGEKEADPVLNAEGLAELDPKTGEPVIEYNWLRRPDPATALKLAMDMAEFHIPKLARTELVGNNKQPIAIAVEFVSARKPDPVP